jgi:hypothetical protein
MRSRTHRGWSSLLPFRLIGLGSVALAIVAKHATAQSPIAAARHIAIPVVPPRPEDVGTIDAIVRASYETISGPAGQSRQWGRDRTLYASQAYFVETGIDPKTGTAFAHGMTYQEYADQAGPDLEKYGYFEREIGRSTQVFGHIASVTSAWEARTEAHGKVIGRGVNSIQLVNDGQRWWITSINWDNESASNPIPPTLLAARP